MLHILVLYLIFSKAIAENHSPDTKEQKNDFNFVLPNYFTSLDLHFEFHPEAHPPTIIQPTTEHPAITTYHPHSSTTPISRPTLPPKPTKIPHVNPLTSSNQQNINSPIGFEIPCGIGKADENDDTRIVNGTDAIRGEFPWLVSVQLKSGLVWRHICGGVIISRNFVISAGHCVADLPVSSLSVVAGDYNLYIHEGNEQRSDIVRIIGRKGFVRDNFTEDIALLQLEPYLRMDGTWVAPICLPSSNQHYPVGRKAMVAGWGRLSEDGTLPEILQKVSLPIMNISRCADLYKQSGFSQFFHTCQICSGWEDGGSDSCQGDSGGPLACKEENGRYYLCGVVSWGIGCARPKYPGIYTEVSCYSQWIADILYNRPAALTQIKDL